MSKFTFEQRATLLQAIIANVEHLKFLHLMTGLEASGQTGDDTPFRLANGSGEKNFHEAALRLLETCGQLVGVPLRIWTSPDDDVEQRDPYDDDYLDEGEFE